MEILNEKNYNEKTEKGLVVVDFFANWCGPCRMMSPILEEVQKDMGEKVKIYKVDVDESENLARQFGIMSIPTILIYKDGEIVNKHIGLWMKDSMMEELNEHKYHTALILQILS